MSLRGRFERLRRQAQAHVSARGTSCDVCLRSRQTARLVGLYEEGEEARNCPGCGHPVTSTGEPIGYVESDGTWHGKIIVLENEDEESEDDEVAVAVT